MSFSVFFSIVFPGRVLEPLLRHFEDFGVQFSIKIEPQNGFFEKKAYMRSARAGSSGLLVGPPRIVPEIDKKRSGKPDRFQGMLFHNFYDFGNYVGSLLAPFGYPFLRN